MGQVASAGDNAAMESFFLGRIHRACTPNSMGSDYNRARMDRTVSSSMKQMSLSTTR